MFQLDLYFEILDLTKTKVLLNLIGLQFIFLLRYGMANAINDY